MSAGFGLSPTRKGLIGWRTLVIDCADFAEVSEEPSREMLFPITIYLLWMHFFCIDFDVHLGTCKSIFWPYKCEFQLHRCTLLQPCTATKEILGVAHRSARDSIEDELKCFMLELAR